MFHSVPFLDSGISDRVSLCFFKSSRLLPLSYATMLWTNAFGIAVPVSTTSVCTLDGWLSLRASKCTLSSNLRVTQEYDPKQEASRILITDDALERIDERLTA